MRNDVVSITVLGVIGGSALLLTFGSWADAGLPERFFGDPPQLTPLIPPRIPIPDLPEEPEPEPEPLTPDEVVTDAQDRLHEATSPDMQEVEGEALAPAPVREATEDEPCQFRVNDLVVARRIRAYAPDGIERPYEANGRPLFAYVDVTCSRSEVNSARIRWIHEETGFVLPSEITIQRGRNWRTWAEQTLPPTRFGTWTVQVIDNEGCLVQSESFDTLPVGWE